MSVLQHLGLVDEIIPLHGYYLKIRLIPSLSDECFLEQLRSFNEGQKVDVFHSLFNGDGTVLVSPPPPPPPPPMRYVEDVEVKEVARPHSALFLEGPPSRIKLDFVTEWATTLGLMDIAVSWRSGPTGSCVAVTFVAPVYLVPPSSIVLANGRCYRLCFFATLSETFDRSYPEEVRAQKKGTLLDFLVSAKVSSLPPDAEKVVQEVRESYPQELRSLIEGPIAQDASEGTHSSVTCSTSGVSPITAAFTTTFTTAAVPDARLLLSLLTLFKLSLLRF